MDLSKLKEVMPFKWRVQSQNENGAQCVAYIDSRQAAEKLDDVVGPLGWQSDYRVIEGKLYGGVAVRDGDNGWVWKWDCGTESNTEKEKGQASDAFKRAAVKWGVGRFLYDQGLERVKVKKHTNGKYYPCDDSGKILWTGDDLTNYLNKRKDASSGTSQRYEKPQTEPTYTVPTPAWSKKVMDKAGKVEKDGLKGSAALLKYIPEFNEKNKTEYKEVKDFNTDKLLNKLIKFVEEVVPAEMAL